MPKRIAQELLQNLSVHQIADLLAKIFGILEYQQIQTILDDLDKQTAELLNRLLAQQVPDQQKMSLPEPIDELTLRLNTLLDEWKRIVGDLGNDEGVYIHRKCEWEMTTFNCEFFFETVEKWAGLFLEDIESFFQKSMVPENFFQKCLEEIEMGIYEFPEWMELDDNIFSIGPHFSRAYTIWEWLNACNYDDPIHVFLQHFIETENELELVKLDNASWYNYLTGLPRETRQKFYQYLNDRQELGEWHQRLHQADGYWQRFYNQLSEEFNPEKYLATYRDKLHQNWRSVLALLDFLKKRGEWREGLQVIAQVWPIYLKQKNKRWQVQDQLLVEIDPHFQLGNPDPDMLGLLEWWEQALEYTDTPALAAVIHFQRKVYGIVDSWDDFKSDYINLREKSSPNVIERLYRRWKTFLVSHTFNIPLDIKRERLDTWVDWLLDIDILQEETVQKTASRLLEWIRGIQKKDHLFRVNYASIYSLTRDIMQISEMPKHYPHLFTYILSTPDEYPLLQKFRQDRLKDVLRYQMEIEENLIECWRGNIATLVPNPAQARHSDYSQYAHWLLVVYELDPPTYYSVIEQWKIEHRKRRNLWYALEAVHLPLEFHRK